MVTKKLERCLLCIDLTNIYTDGCQSCISPWRQLLATFNEMYEERSRRDHYNTTSQAYKLYDVMWALALALNKILAMAHLSIVSIEN